LIRHCAKCHAEYTLGPISFDSGFCPKCRPRFLSAPLCLQPIPAGTRDLWLLMIGIHVIIFFTFGAIPSAEISIPVSIYCVTVFLYVGFRFVLAKFRGFPVLSRFQAIALLLLPLYGPALFILVFCVGQVLRMHV